MHIYILPLLAFLGPKGRSERPFKVCLDDLDVLGLVLEVLPGAEPLHFGLLCVPVLDLLHTAADLTLTTLGLKIAGNIILSYKISINLTIIDMVSIISLVSDYL